MDEQRKRFTSSGRTEAEFNQDEYEADVRRRIIELTFMGNKLLENPEQKLSEGEESWLAIKNYSDRL